MNDNDNDIDIDIDINIDNDNDIDTGTETYPDPNTDTDNGIAIDNDIDNDTDNGNWQCRSHWHWLNSKINIFFDRQGIVKTWVLLQVMHQDYICIMAWLVWCQGWHLEECVIYLGSTHVTCIEVHFWLPGCQPYFFLSLKPLFVC